jgi:hypothetical protein
VYIGRSNHHCVFGTVMFERRWTMEKQIAEYNEYDGIDASLETSLFEYGMIWAKGIEGHEKDYHFIYGVGINPFTSEYNSFDWADIAIDTDPRKEWDFVEWEKVLSFVGMNEDDFFNQPLPQIVYDLVSYYGHENIFGSSYYPFEIKEA